jgi:hypothetical protein
MSVDADFIERTLQRIVEEEERTILRKLSEVDSMFIKGGHGGGSSPWTMERDRVTEEEVSHAAQRIMSEIRELAGEKVPQFADLGAAYVGHLGHRLIDHYRAGPGSTKEALVAALLKIKDRTRDELTHRPVQSTPGPASLAGRDINITTAGHVAVAGRNVHQHVEGVEIATLLPILSDARRTVEVAQMAAQEREDLLDIISAMVSLAQQPKPDKAGLSRWGGRLLKTVGAVGGPVASNLVWELLKQHLHLP